MLTTVRRFRGDEDRPTSYLWRLISSIKISSTFYTLDEALLKRSYDPTPSQEEAIYRALVKLADIDSRPHRNKDLLDRERARRAAKTPQGAQRAGNVFYVPTSILVPKTWKVVPNMLPTAYIYGDLGIIASVFFTPQYQEYLELALAWVAAWQNITEQGEQLLKIDYQVTLKNEDIFKDSYAAWFIPKARYNAAPFYLNHDLPAIRDNTGLSKPPTLTDVIRPQPITILSTGGQDYTEFSYTRKIEGRRKATSYTESEKTADSTSTNQSKGNSTSKTHSSTHSQGHGTKEGGGASVNVWNTNQPTWGYESTSSNTSTDGVSNGQVESIIDSTKQGTTKSKGTSISDASVILDEELHGHRSLITYARTLYRWLEDTANHPQEEAYYLDAMPHCKHRESKKLHETLTETARRMLLYHESIEEIAAHARRMHLLADAYTAYALGYEGLLSEFLTRFAQFEGVDTIDTFRFYELTAVRLDSLKTFDIRPFPHWSQMAALQRIEKP